MHRAIITIMILIISVTGAYAMNADFYVSPQGNDAWSGTLPTPNEMRTDGPFATVQRAQKAVRAMKPSKTHPACVLLREGTYEITSPLLFGPEDSWTTYAAYPTEKPIISGGHRITGWTNAGNGVWTTKVALSPTRPVTHSPTLVPYFRDLYVNGHRRERPRLPKDGFFHIDESLGNDIKNTFRYAEGEVRPWKNLDDVEVVVINSWDMTRFHIKSIDEKSRVITFTGDNRWYWGQWGQGNHQRYYADNVLEGFTEPGQWYLDRQSGVLSYRPMPGENMRTAEVVAPAINELMHVRGDDRNQVQQLHLQGLAFRYAGWDLPMEGQQSGQAASSVPGVVIAERLRDSSIRDCEFSNIAQYALEIGIATNVLIKGNTIHDMGAGGIKIHGGDHNTITRNHLYDLGRTYPPAVGIWIGNAGHNTISYNHIHDLLYSGISVGWSWGYADTGTKANIIEHNHIHDLGKGLLSDLSGIYTLGTSTGTVIRYNLIHDSDSATYGGWGIYLDEGSSGILVENNICYRTKTGGFHQHYGKDNVIRNNIFAFGRENGIQRTRQEEHVSFTFEHNLVYGNTGPLLRGQWDDPKTYKCDYNIYWTVKEADWFEVYKGMDFRKWQTPEREAHSTLCDPLFVDPEHGDFRFKPGSPAEKLGFKPIVRCGD